ncbi:DUF6193 family natural product biosynthesis protein [Streptomyces sp. NPDC094437]|uniref:DUF6193 family natural product biosynthesis protein n=1 Tax=Streptomyces sp. NPDC094437 TaxID=3366060 RepID=UPI00382BBA18
MIDEVLYPDIASMGGLASAMETVAQSKGIDLGGMYSRYASGLGLLTSAEVDSDRGRVYVYLGKEDRIFLVGIYQPGITWADGATDDFSRLVEAVAAWQVGVTVDEFVEEFPFMTLGRLARSLESGDPIAAQWDFLRKSEIYVAERELVHAVYADGRFRRLFPTLSHGTLGLSLDRLGSAAARGIRIIPLEGGSWRIEDSSSPAAKVVASLDEAIAAAAEFLDGE